MLAAYPDIVDKLVEQAKQASVPHAKLCFELLDARARKSDDEDEEDGTTLAEYLIEQLQLTPPPNEDASEEETV